MRSDVLSRRPPSPQACSSKYISISSTRGKRIQKKSRNSDSSSMNVTLSKGSAFFFAFAECFSGNYTCRALELLEDTQGEVGEG